MRLHLSQHIPLINNGLTFFSLSASDLVMKVDALLTAAPKGEVRRDVRFVKDSHRWATTFFFRPLFTVLFALPSHKVEGGVYTPFVKMDLKIASPSFPEVQEKNESFYLRFC